MTRSSRHTPRRLAFALQLGAALTAADCRREPPASGVTSPNRSIPALAVSSLAVELHQIAEALPAGWVLSFDEGEHSLGDAGGQTHLRRVVQFHDPRSRCEIHFGAGGTQTRIEPLVVRLFVYRRDDEAALHRDEAPFAELSSHCPQDIGLGRTASYFVAVDVCDRAFAADPVCAQRVAELESALRRTLGSGRSPGPTQ